MLFDLETQLRAYTFKMSFLCKECDSHNLVIGLATKFGPFITKVILLHLLRRITIMEFQASIGSPKALRDFAAGGRQMLALKNPVISRRI